MLPLFFYPCNTKCLPLYTLHPLFEPTYLYHCDVISPIEIILTTTEGTNLTFEKVWITSSWSFILTLPYAFNLHFSTITHFILATSSFVAKKQIIFILNTFYYISLGVGAIFVHMSLFFQVLHFFEPHLHMTILTTIVTF